MLRKLFMAGLVAAFASAAAPWRASLTLHVPQAYAPSRRSGVRAARREAQRRRNRARSGK